MPYTTREVDGFQVKNKRTGKVHAKHSTKANAAAQVRLLHGVEHGMVPKTTRQAAGLTDKDLAPYGGAKKPGSRSKLGPWVSSTGKTSKSVHKGTAKAGRSPGRGR